MQSKCFSFFTKSNVVLVLSHYLCVFQNLKIALNCFLEKKEKSSQLECFRKRENEIFYIALRERFI